MQKSNPSPIDELAKVQLTGEELMILRLRRTMTLEEMATRLGITKQGVSRALQVATAKWEAQKDGLRA